MGERRRRCWEAKLSMSLGGGTLCGSACPKIMGHSPTPTLHGKGWVTDLLLGFLAKISAELMPKEHKDFVCPPEGIFLAMTFLPMTQPQYKISGVFS